MNFLTIGNVAYALRAAVAIGLLATAAVAHEGRRFRIDVQSGQLVATGVNTGPDDGAPASRPYANSLHDHWRNSLLGLDAASATLPGFDLLSPAAELVNWPLRATLLDVHRWNSPPTEPPAGTVPQLSLLDAGESLRISSGPQSIASTAPGTLVLLPSVPADGASDIDLLYEINRRPSDSIAIIRLVLHSGNPAIADSDPVHVILSPDGANPMQRLHHASLYLEQYLAGHGVPEPAALALLLPVVAVAVYRQRARKTAVVLSVHQIPPTGNAAKWSR